MQVQVLKLIFMELSFQPKIGLYNSKKEDFSINEEKSASLSSCILK